ncbi:uncharacterized protein LOC113940358 isoform X2 [Corapipo altera]|uniref:uncharacterized protein LOC113940358 isoform X2 n=1 Tax=Corapipo altera TaxID=415028 RepID=UPI000FD6B7D5|nr:uncharacterized protein LOC113940358 isoform X2 [Corapipo altera]
MESGIDPGQEYYGQDYYSYEHGYELPQYGSRRRLLSPAGMYDEYGEVVVESDGGYYYSPHGPTAEEGMSQVRGAPSRGISQAAGAQRGARPLGGGMDPRRGPGPYRTSQGKRRLKAVMHVSRVAVSAHKPVGRAESARSRWKKAKIFPMILQKVKGSRKDSSYAKLMSARQADGDKSMIIRGSYFQKSTDDRPSMRKLNHVLKRISVSRKLQEPLGKDLARGEEESEREEAKSGVSISITAESEQEDSDYEKKKKKRRRHTSDESSEKSSSSGSESEDKDYLKITLDQDEATESTVDSDEETEQDLGDSEDDSESSSSGESEEDSSEEDDDEEDSDSDEDGSLSKSSSTRSSYSRSGTSESSSIRSTEKSSIKSRGGSSHGRARRSNQKSSSSTASGSDRDTSYRKTSGSSYKSKTSSASVGIEDTIEEVSEEEEEADETADSSSKAASKTSAKPGEGKKGKSAVSGEESEEESAEEADTDGSDREETLMGQKEKDQVDSGPGVRDQLHGRGQRSRLGPEEPAQQPQRATQRQREHLHRPERLRGQDPACLPRQ